MEGADHFGPMQQSAALARVIDRRVLV